MTGEKVGVIGGDVSDPLGQGGGEGFGEQAELT